MSNPKNEDRNVPAWGKKMVFYLLLAFVAGAVATLLILSCLAYTDQLSTVSSVSRDPNFFARFDPFGSQGLLVHSFNQSLASLSPSHSIASSSSTSSSTSSLTEINNVVDGDTYTDSNDFESTTIFAYHSPNSDASAVGFGAEILKTQGYETFNLGHTTVMKSFFSSGPRPTNVAYITNYKESITNTLAKPFDLYDDKSDTAAWAAHHWTRKAVNDLAKQQRLKLMLMYHDDDSTNREVDDWICLFLTDFMSLFYPESVNGQFQGIYDAHEVMPSLTFLNIRNISQDTQNVENERLQRMSLNAMNEKFDLQRCHVVKRKLQEEKEYMWDCRDSPLKIKPNQMKVINLGIHKTGSTTLHELFQHIGLRSVHWKGHMYNKTVVQMICADNGTNCNSLPNGLKPLVKAGYTAVAQMDTRGFYPQISNFKQIIESNPEAYFIISLRDQARHIESMKHWTHLYEILADKAKDFNAIPMFPDLLDTLQTEKDILHSQRMDYNFELWLLRYHYQVIKYFVQHPGYKWTLFDLDQKPEEMQSNLENFFGCKKLTIGKANVNSYTASK